MKTRSWAVLVLSISVSIVSWAQQTASQPAVSSPKNAKTTEEIVKAVEPSKGFGQIQSAEFNRWGRRVFAAWYCPFSGRGDVFLVAYYYDYDKAQWIQFMNQLVAASGDLSAEMPPGDKIIFRTGGKVAVEESVAKFPQKKE